MPNFRKRRACIAHAYGNNFINEQEFVLLYDCYKSTSFRAGIKTGSFWKRNQTTDERPSFVSTGRTFISLTVSCFDRFQQLSVLVELIALAMALQQCRRSRRSFLEGIERKLCKTNLTSSCFQDAGKSIPRRSSPLARSWQVLGEARAVSMSRNLAAASCKRRRFVSSLQGRRPLQTLSLCPPQGSLI